MGLADPKTRQYVSISEWKDGNGDDRRVASSPSHICADRVHTCAFLAFDPAVAKLAGRGIASRLGSACLVRYIPVNLLASHYEFDNSLEETSTRGTKPRGMIRHLCHFCRTNCLQLLPSCRAVTDMFKYAVLISCVALICTIVRTPTCNEARMSAVVEQALRVIRPCYIWKYSTNVP